MVVLMRGSTTDDDWAANFNYPFCSAADAAEIGVPGRVHTGFLLYMEQVGGWVVRLKRDSSLLIDDD